MYCFLQSLQDFSRDSKTSSNLPSVFESLKSIVSILQTKTNRGSFNQTTRCTWMIWAVTAHKFVVKLLYDKNSIVYSQFSHNCFNLSVYGQTVKDEFYCLSLLRLRPAGKTPYLIKYSRAHRPFCVKGKKKKQKKKTKKKTLLSFPKAKNLWNFQTE